MLHSLALLAIFLASCYFLSRRGLRYLRYFQQEQYIHGRYVGWYKARGAFDKAGTAVAAAALSLSLLSGGRAIASLVSIVAAGALALFAALEEDPRESGKLKLKMTERARRIHCVSLACYLVLSLTGVLLAGCLARPLELAWVWQIAIFQAAPFVILFADKLLAPLEKKIQDSFVAEAKQILSNVSPFTIGITGSYGKTSTKAMLGELSGICLGPTFWPEKGVNSPMGITREIREKLRPYHRYAVIEMGMFQRGSIRRLCDLVPPRAGIITAVGAMHLERAGSLENIQLGKAELAEAIPEDGILVCNGDNPGSRKIAADHPKRVTLLYGMNPDAGHLDCVATNVRTTPEGMRFTIRWKGREHEALVSQLGEPAVSNALAAFCTTCALGGDPELAIAALANLEAVDNRLQLQKAGGVTRLKDAYNSNPVGFSAALRVLRDLPAKRRFLVTPGMIELGERQYDENHGVAEQAAKVCDRVLVVGEVNRKALTAGLKAGGIAEEKVLVFDRMADALAKLESEAEEGDVVLIENDLPDLYEGPARF